MSESVDAAVIEKIVGSSRHPTKHYGRAVSESEMVYILHSQRCLDTGRDLRKCYYTTALDRGINVDEWIEDEPLPLRVRGGRLAPAWGGWSRRDEG